MKLKSIRPSLVMLSAVLGYLGVAIGGLFITNPSQRLTTGALLLLFGLVYFLPDHQNYSNRGLHILTGIQAALVTGLMLLQPGWGVYPLLFMLMGPEVMGWFRSPGGFIWTGIFILISGIIFIASQGIIGIILLLPYTAGYTFFAIFGWLLFQAEQARERSDQLLAELQQAHRQLQDYAARQEELTIAQERNRIAREMHDTIGHRLTIASVQLEGAQRLIHSDPERADRILSTVREQVREGLGELRRTVAMLRASVEEDLPIEQALGKLAGQVEEGTGMRIHLSLQDCLPPLPPPYRQALYRAAQEGLTNISRHAQAGEAWIQLAVRDEDLVLLISDNGIGISSGADQPGFGLIGLKERAAVLGGDSFVDPRPGGGTQLTFRLPLPHEDENE